MLTTHVEMCGQCQHPFDDHVLKGPGDPPMWGWMTCPVEGCLCWMTWSLTGIQSEQVMDLITEWVRTTGRPAR